MPIWDPEGAQRAVFVEGGFDPDEYVEAHDLARGLMGRGWLECFARIADEPAPQSC